MAFAWREDLRTGVDDIDKQHKELIARLNKLIEACNWPAGNRQVGEYLAFLNEYVNFHFAAEEREMTTHAYPGLAGHAGEHREFRKRVNDLCRQHEQQGANLSVLLKTISSSGEWLVSHIMKADKEMAQFLVQAGK
jgi:hemerythrin